MSKNLIRTVYSAVFESVLCTSITVWFGFATKPDRNRLPQTVETAERFIGIPLSALQNFQSEAMSRQIISDPTHQRHKLYELLPSSQNNQTVQCNIKHLCKMKIHIYTLITTCGQYSVHYLLYLI